MPFRATLLSLLALAALASPAQTLDALPWLTDPERIVTENVEDPLFIFFYRPGDVQSDRMQSWTFTNRRVIRALQGLRTIRVDVDLRPHLAERYVVRQVPTSLLITPQDHEFGRQEQHLGPDELVAWVDQSLGRIDALEPEPTPSRNAPATSDAILEDMFTQEEREVEVGPPGLPPPPETEIAEAVDVRHRAPRQTRAGEDLPLQIYVPDGASRVTLHHRAPGEELFHDVSMTPNTPTLFFAVIPGDKVTFRGLEYYFTIAKEGRSASFPTQGPARPIEVAVR
jgi:hypothetical protein